MLNFFRKSRPILEQEKLNELENFIPPFALSASCLTLYFAEDRITVLPFLVLYFAFNVLMTALRNRSVQSKFLRLELIRFFINPLILFLIISFSGRNSIGWLLCLPGVIWAPLVTGSNLVLLPVSFSYIAILGAAGYFTHSDLSFVMQQMLTVPSVLLLTLLLFGMIGDIQKVRIQNILQSIPLTVFTCNREGVIDFINRAIPPLSEADIIGRHILDFTPPHDHARVKEYFQKVIEEGIIVNYDVDISQNASNVWLNVYISPILENGKVKETVFILQDVTEKRLMEIQLRTAKDEAEKSSLIKSQFLAAMSHEIRTPLNGVIGFSDLLSRTSLNAVQKNYSENINSSANHLMNIINDILDFSKIQSGKMNIHLSECNLKKLTGDLMKTFSMQAEKKNLKMLLNFPENIPENVRADSVRIRQILFNLMGNALKFTNEGSVSLDVRFFPSQSRGILNYQFTVKDTGIGIPAERVGELFKEFTQIDMSAERKFGGSGLGLSISKNLAELMDGSISYSPREERGSKFTLTLPLEISTDSSDFNKSQNHPVRISVTDSQKKLKILAVDDNEMNLLLIRSMLEMMNMDNDEAVSGKDALELISQNNYDLILLDIEMPEMSGLETLKEIRKIEIAQNRKIFIIACTAHALEGSREKFLNAGFNAYLSKPISLFRLKETLTMLS